MSDPMKLQPSARLGGSGAIDGVQHSGGPGGFSGRVAGSLGSGFGACKPRTLSARKQRIYAARATSDIETLHAGSGGHDTAIVSREQVSHHVYIVGAARYGRDEMSLWHLESLDPIVHCEECGVQHGDCARVAEVDIGPPRLVLLDMWRERRVRCSEA